VATAEEMPVNETLWLRDVLEKEELPLDEVIVNSLYPERFDAKDEAELRGVLAKRPGRLQRAAVRAALSERTRVGRQRAELDRLGDGLELEPIELPFLFAESLGPPELELLADALEAGLANRDAVPVSR